MLVVTGRYSILTAKLTLPLTGKVQIRRPQLQRVDAHREPVLSYDLPVSTVVLPLKIVEVITTLELNSEIEVADGIVRAASWSCPGIIPENDCSIV